MATGKKTERAAPASRPRAGKVASNSPKAGKVVAGHPDTPRRYFALNRAFPLRPIRDDDELARANEVISRLLRRDDLDAAEEDYLDVLGRLVEGYEDEAHPMPDVAGEAMLRHILESRGLTQAAVARGAGIAEPTVSAILSGRRALNRAHIEALSACLGVSPALFLAAAPTRKQN